MMTSTTPSESPVLPWNTSITSEKFSLDPLADLTPRLYKVAGKPIPFFGLRDLGKVLGGREPDTMRKWEENGWLPKPTAVFPGRDPRNAKSARNGRRRLYTRAQLIGLYQIAYEEGLLNKRAHVTETRFAQRARKLFEDLAAVELEEQTRSGRDN